jgi:hypothetical protein
MVSRASDITGSSYFLRTSTGSIPDSSGRDLIWCVSPHTLPYCLRRVDRGYMRDM